MFTNNLLPGKILNHWSDSKPAVSLLNATNTVFSRIANTSFLRDKHEEFGTQQNKANTVTESPFKAVEKQSEKLLASEADITNESNEWDNDDWGDSWEDHWGNEDGSQSNISDENAPSVKKSSSDFIQSKSDAFTQLIDSNVRSQPKPETEKSEPKSDDQLLNNDGWNEDWGNEKDTNVALNEAPDEIPDFEPPEPETTLEMISNDLIVHVAEASKCEKEQSEILLTECLTEKVPDNPIMNESGWNDNWASEDVTHSSVSDQILLIEKSSTESFESKSDASSQLIEDDEHSQPKPEAESKDVETKSENQWDDDWGSEDDTKSNVSDQIVIPKEKSSDLSESKSNASSQLIEDDVHFQPKPEAEKKDVETKSDNQWDDNWGNEDDTKSSVPVQIISSADKPSTGFFGSKSDPSSQLIKDDVRSQPKPEAEKKAETQSDNQLLNNDDWNDDWGNYDEDSKPNVSALGKSEPTVDSKQMLSKLNTSNNLSTNNVSAQPKLQTSELKEVKAKEDKPILVKKTKSKVTSTAKLFSSSTSTQLKAPVKSKNEWANDDWGNDWDDFEPLTLSDRRSSAQTDLSIDSDWSADWEVKPKPKVQKHPKPSPSTTFPRASKSISDDHFISNQQLKPTPSSSSTSDSQIMNDQQSVMQNQYKPTLSQQQTGEASGASWFSDFRSATRTAALTTVTHAVNRWSFNPTNILDAVGKFILNSPIYFFVILKLNFSTQWKTSVVQLVFLRPKKWQPLCDNSNVKNNTFQLFCRAIVMLLFELILYLYS